MIGLLNELIQINIQNRSIIKKIQRNIKIELTTGMKCICFDDSSNIDSCFGKLQRIDSIIQQNVIKMQKIVDVEYMEDQLLKVIKKLKQKLIADAIEKVNDIQKDETGQNN